MAGAIAMQSPAPFPVVHRAAGGHRRGFRQMLWQWRHSETVSFTLNGVPVALVMLYRWGRRRQELALWIAPEAAPHLRRLIRLTHLTLKQYADDGVLTCANVDPGDDTARRFAQLAGFRRARFGLRPSLMVWRP